MDADPAQVLEDACQAAVKAPEFQPAGGVTHCNQAVRRIAQTLGCRELDDLSLTADKMIAVMSQGWRKVPGGDAAIAALTGKLVVAAMSSYRLQEEHGHVAAVYPCARQRSGSLGIDVPLVANVGKKCGVMVSSLAFPVAMGEADYFEWPG